MKIPPSYSITSEMLLLISQIEAERLYFSSLALPQPIKEKIQRVSLLKSSLFSARIEGNPLRFSDLETGRAKDDTKQEIFNIVDAANILDKTGKEKITKNLLLQLHARVLRDISPDAGHFRKEISAIFNQAGVAVYMPPPPNSVLGLVDRLLAYCNSDKEKFALINAFVSHLVFEKIHPFLDGNGRVGRLLIAAVLKAKGWDFVFTVPLEEYLDENKDEYYFHLDRGMQHTNDYLLFMLGAFHEEMERIRGQIEKEAAKIEEPFLPPRQEEIYNIIKDHVVVSFDMIRRRFLQVPHRTLRYDLKKLVDSGFIEKTGEKRGRYYRVRKG